MTGDFSDQGPNFMSLCELVVTKVQSTLAPHSSFHIFARQATVKSTVDEGWE